MKVEPRGWVILGTVLGTSALGYALQRNPPGALHSLGTLLCGGTVLAIVVGGFVLYVAAAKSVANKREEYESALPDALTALFNPTHKVDVSPDIYRPTRDERVICAAPCERMALKRKVERYQYAGFTGRVKLAKGIYYRMGDLSVRRIEREVLESMGEGVLIVTTKKLVFNAAGSGANWSKTWRSVVTWALAEDAIEVQLTSGKPVFFALRPTIDPTHLDQDPRYVAAALEAGYSSQS